MEKLKNILKKLPREKVIIILCAILSGVTLIVSVVVFAAADSDSSKKSTQSSYPIFQNIGNYSPDSPKSLGFQSLDNNTCIVVSIGAFSGEDLEIPERSPYGETVVGIASGAFEGCEELVSVHIPASVTSIGEGVFKGCTSLCAISVDRANAAFSASGGILYSKSKSILICYPASRAGSSYLLNPNVKSIATDAFYGVNSLKSIYYEGSIEEYSNISVGEGNRILSSIPITCNYSPSK